MKKCKYAGDVNDEYCKDCNGCEMEFEGRSVAATECAGYEESTEEVKEVAVEDTVVDEADFPMNPPEEPKELDEPVKEEKPKKKSYYQKQKEKKEKEKQAEKVAIIETEKVSEKPTNSEIVTFNHSKVRSIRVMSGVTREVNGQYFKFTYEMENEVDPEITPEQLAEEKEKMWAMANLEVDSQLADVLK